MRWVFLNVHALCKLIRMNTFHEKQRYGNPQKMCGCVVLTALVLFTTTQPLHAVGTTLHGEAAVRGAMWFDVASHPEYREWVAAYPDALRAGSSFPDWGFAVDGFHDPAEAAHWQPFYEAAVRYVRETYPKPWDEETKRLVVFMLGVICHGIADLDWHGLGGVEEGMIDLMSAQETGNQGKFSPGWQQSHTNADIGGEFIGAPQLDLSWMDDGWYVPVDDMAAIYAMVGHGHVTARDITRGMTKLLAGQIGVRTAGLVGFGCGEWSHRSPALTTELRDYFAGGLDDMAVQSAWEWETFLDWLEKGVPESGLVRASSYLSEPLESLLTGRDRALHRGGDRRHRERLGPVKMSNFAQSAIRVVETARGVYLSVPPVKEPASESAGGRPRGEECSVTFIGSEPYGYAGASLAWGDLSGDGVVDLVIGSPGYSEIGRARCGRVRILLGGDDIEGREVRDLAESADVTLTGDEIFGRFGLAVALCDLNADGRADLAVSSPTSGARGHGYQGKVEVFFGRESGGIEETAGITIATDAVYTNLGHGLDAGDFDRDGRLDLVVSTPFARAGGRQRGLAAVFLADPSYGAGRRLDLGEADWRVEGEQSYGWFGYAVAPADGPRGEPLLLVGAPKYKAGDVQAVGRLHAYDLTGIAEGTASTSPVFTITGDMEFDNLGTAFAVGDPLGTGDPVLALASPSRSAGGFTQNGDVIVASMEGLSGEVDRGALSLLATMEGRRPLARLGWRLGFADVSGDGIDDLVVTQPWRDWGPFRRLTGAVYAWFGGARFPSGGGTLTPGSAQRRIVGTEGAALFGATLAFPDFDADGTPDLAVGARILSTAAPEGGSVGIYGSFAIGCDRHLP